MSYRLIYAWRCAGCQNELRTESELNGQPSAFSCSTCGTIFSTSEILTVAETYAEKDAAPDRELQPKHKRISKPLSKNKLQRYKSLERAETERVRRLDGEDDD